MLFLPPPHSSNLGYLLSPVPHPRNIHQRLIYNPCPLGATGHLESAEKCYMRVTYLCIHSTDMHEYLFPVALILEAVLEAGGLFGEQKRPSPCPHMGC